jgi:hypothetical protein
MQILGFWQLTEKDQPPEEYYGDDEMIKEWFDSVKARYSEGSGSEPMETVPQTQNELTKELLG